jgi:hypothetical protein
MIYQWKPGSAVKVDPQIAGEELDRIRTWNNGRLTSEMVVEASRGADAPLHSAFEWDDRKAAQAHRLEQARYVIRSVEIIIDKGGEESMPIRAFVSVLRDEDRSFTSTVHALADPDLRAQVLADAWKELEAWRKRHAELVEFARVFSAIDQARLAE